MIDKTLRMALLFDAYGSLLTDKQQEFFTLYYSEDLSLGEIALNYSISRQAVYDILKRSEITLTEYEERLGLVAQKEIAATQVEKMRFVLAQLESSLQLLPPVERLKAVEAIKALQNGLDSL